MEGQTIASILRHDLHAAPIFKGVYSADTLPVLPETPGAYVVNTDIAGNPGLHWVTFYFPENGLPEYFDSFGLKPIDENFTDFIFSSRAKSYKYNTFQLQHIQSKVCGHYCLFYLLKRSRNQNFEDILNYFSVNTKKNDKKLLYMLNDML